jgi:hypothetical protein
MQVRQGVDCRLKEQESHISKLISVITGGQAFMLYTITVSKKTSRMVR